MPLNCLQKKILQKTSTLAIFQSQLCLKHVISPCDPDQYKHKNPIYQYPLDLNLQTGCVEKCCQKDRVDENFSTHVLLWINACFMSHQ